MRLRAARDLVENATSVAQKRKQGLPTYKVDPIPGFEKAVAELSEIEKMPSYHMVEIDELLNKARTTWINACVDGIKAAVDSNDEKIMEKALQRVEELRKSSLLTDSALKTLVTELHCKYLETQYDNLTGALEVNWALIAENRRQKIEIPGVVRTQELYEQHRRAVRKYLEEQVSRKTHDRQQKGYLDAQEFLAKEIESNVAARNDQGMIVILVKLYWQTQDWVKAKNAAQLFIQIGSVDGRKQAVIWNKLTDVVKDLTENNLDAAKSALTKLESEHGDIVADERFELLQGTLNRLIAEAKAAEAQHLDDSYVKAAELYALAYTINPRNPDPQGGMDFHDNEVEDGLRSLGARLKPGIRQRLERAKI